MRFPHWNVIGAQDKNTPFVVKKGDKLKFIDLELADTGTYSYNGDTDYITGADSSFPFNSSHFDVTQYSGYKLLSCRSEMESTQAVSNTVDIKDLSLPWKITTSGGSIITSGSCDIKVYVPLKTPINSNSPCLKEDGCSTDHLNGLSESLLNISCKAAKGASTEAETFSLLWKKIQTCRIELLDGRVLTYWGAGNATPGIHWTTDELLTSGHGRCHHWSLFFVDLLRSQGIVAYYQNNATSFTIGAIANANIGFNPINGHAFYYGNNYPQNSPVCLRQQGTRFQGGGNPNAVNFQNHVINTYNSKLYDATCGKGEYAYSPNGFLQYLRENCYITINNETVLPGSALEINYFLTDDDNLIEED